MTTLVSGSCANCARAIAGPEQKFCPACGQPTPAHRIDWHFLGHELEHSVLHMDRGILYSLKNLMLRPGHLMRDYIEGRRANQVKPLLLLMVMAAVVVILTKYLLGGEVMDQTVFAGAADAAQSSAKAQFDVAKLTVAMTAVQDWTNKHFAAFTVLLLPLEAAAFRLSFGRVGKLNYPEWLVITTFLTVQTLVLWSLSVPLRWWIPHSLVQSVILVLSFGYGCFSLIQFLQGYPRWKSILRTLLGLCIFMLIGQVLTMLAVAGVFVISN